MGKVPGLLAKSAGAAFLAACLAAAPTPVAPAGHGKKSAAPAAFKRVSLADFVKNEKSLASFRKGVKKMRELPPTDPRSWTFQANIHWRPFFPDYVYDQARKAGDPARRLFRDDTGFTPDPNVFNQCPHGNWWFLPWHRAYLHYFERILRWAADDPELTLPYWNYSDAAQRELPPAFRAARAGKEDNPLYLPASVTFEDRVGKPQTFLMRDAPLLRGETQLTASVTRLDALAAVPFTNVKPAPANLGFAGPAACDLACVCGFGALESVPHNRIHTAVGGSAAQAGGSLRVGFMGDTSTAARDPVFWVHHCNVDRLWASWVALKQGRVHPEDPEWLQQTFTFFDVDAAGKPKPVTVAVQDLLTTEQLGYAYDRLEPLPGALVAQAPSPALPLGGRSFEALAATTAPKAEAGPHPPRGEHAGIRLTRTQVREVAVPLAEGVKPQRVRELAAPAGAKRQGEVVLSLEGIEFDQLPGVDYEVYLNLPEKATLGPDSPHYVGALTFFGLGPHPGGGHGAHRAPRFVRFALPPGLTAALADRPEAFRNLRVQFVPQTGTEPVKRDGKKTDEPPGPRHDERPAVTIRQVRLLFVR